MASIGKAVVDARAAQGLTQSELAGRAGISRQALGAIEAGVYQPSVAIAIRLARELGASVESLFSEIDEGSSTVVEASWFGATRPPSVPQRRVALARVRGKVVAVEQPAAHLTLSSVSGIVQRARGHQADVVTFQNPEEIDSTLLIAGCDPAATILADWLARHRSRVRAVVLPCSSGAALRALAQGRAHAAGVHLRHKDTGEYDLASIEPTVSNRQTTVVNFALWELGLATGSGNPLGIRGFADLARPGLRIVNREKGSGARWVLDRALGELRIRGDRIAGYQFEVGGHLEVAAAIAGGLADIGVTIRLGADAYRLHFVPHCHERYDLVMMKRDTESMPVKAMLDALNSRRFAQEISQLCGYDTRHMGQPVYT